MSPFAIELDARIRNLVRSAGPLSAFRQLIAENDALIRSPELDHGRAITTTRTAIHTILVAEWAAEQVRKLGYEMPFAVMALGGTGRAEVTPCSDLDFAFLF
jgi:UTP:GlnB (protein PII) uridylyltransferase